MSRCLFLGLFLLLMFVVDHGDSARDPCIKEYLGGGGFEFVDCDDAAMNLRYWANHSLRIRIVPGGFYRRVPFFKLFVNRQCTLIFEGRMAEGSKFAEWRTEAGYTLVECEDVSLCDLKIDVNGVMRLIDSSVSRDSLCPAHDLRNPINGGGIVWTTIRFVHPPKLWKLVVDVENAYPDEVEEYFPVTTTPAPWPPPEPTRPTTLRPDPTKEPPYHPIKPPGGNPCIGHFPSLGKIEFDSCDDAEITIKWSKLHQLTLEIGTDTYYQPTQQFHLIINDFCHLVFEGRVNPAFHFARWLATNGTEISHCNDVKTCDIKIGVDGYLRRKDSGQPIEPLCRNTIMRHEVDGEDDVWAKFRVTDIPQGWSLSLVVKDFEPDELKEIDTPGCIHEYKEGGGWQFIHCKDAEVSFKWWRNHTLRVAQLFAPKTDEGVRAFTLVINGQCTLYFNGQNHGEVPWALWRSEDGTVLTECEEPEGCDLKIDVEGVVRRLNSMDSREPLCPYDQPVRNAIDELWVWSWVRVIDFPQDWEMAIDVLHAETDEMAEFFPEEYTPEPLSPTVHPPVHHRHPCIHDYKQGWGGFIFVECEDAELKIKWLSSHKFRAADLTPETSYDGKRTFTIIINDKCKLNFEAQSHPARYAKWLSEDGTTLVRCNNEISCGLKIDTDGELRVDNIAVSKQELCPGVVLRNAIDDRWVWTKIRVVNLPKNWVLLVDVPHPLNGEATEYFP
ncbi:hypothetical protein M3Y95_00798500 [Aphelenchoides besseyi]|nr:hypothetical protein M3Y95_00798500 [Aphelenchoides besseyi]